MAWEWVGPTAGAVVGLGGMVAGRLTSRDVIASTERAAERAAHFDLDMRRREDRREAYVHFNDALSQFEDATTILARRRSAVPESVEEYREAVYYGTLAVSRAYFSVRLVGPEAVQRACYEIQRDASALAESLVQDTTVDRYLIEGGLFAEMHRAMAAALAHDVPVQLGGVAAHEKQRGSE